MTALRLGTRGSSLALTQSRWVAARLEESTGRPVELEVIRTTGDVLLDRPLSEIGGKGLFTKELDDALLERRVDLAVHSLKDLPTELPDGLSIGSVPEREDPRDILIGPLGRATSLASLPRGAVVGTSSLRRTALVKLHRPELEVRSIRGNLDTRVRKVDEGEYAAVVLAAAGIRRLGWAERIDEWLDTGSWLPAPGQGALAVVVRSEDLSSSPWLHFLDHRASRVAVSAERSLLHRLEAGCRLPVAALALPFQGGVRLSGLVADPDGQQMVRAEATGSHDDPVQLGIEVADALLARGADLLLERVRTEMLADDEYGSTSINQPTDT